MTHGLDLACRAGVFDGISARWALHLQGGSGMVEKSGDSSSSSGWI